MGFTTGFIGGVTLTTSLLYLSLTLHQRNRLQQAILLRQQALILNNIVSPTPIEPPPVKRTERVGFEEMIKDRWNGEIEALVRRVQTTDWSAVRDGVEGAAVSAWRSVRRRVDEGVETAKKEDGPVIVGAEGKGKGNEEFVAVK